MYEHFPVRFWNQWLDDRQPTLLVQSLEPGSTPKDILSATALARTPGFSGTETETSVTLAPLWSPDGHEVVFTATTERWNAAFAQVGYHLYRVAADGGAEPSIITPASGDYAEATFSRDGKALFFKYTPEDAEIYRLARLQKLAWPAGGEPTLVTRDFDRETARYALTPDGKFVYLLVPDAANENLYRVSTDGGKPALVLAPVHRRLHRPRDSAKGRQAYLDRQLRQLRQSGGDRAHRSRPARRTSISPRSTPPRRRPSIGSRRSISISPAPRAAIFTT